VCLDDCVFLYEIKKVSERKYAIKDGIL